MPMTAVTIDTCVWLKLVDQEKGDMERQSAEPCACLLDFCLAKGIGLHYSSRLWNYDVVTMRNERDRAFLQQLLENYSAIEDGAGFRLGDLNSPIIGRRGSVFGGPDVLSGGVCDPEARDNFRIVFGPDPIERPAANTGRKLPNWIGDYDALKYHYLNGHDLFVTLDARPPCFSAEMRARALTELKLRICSPEEALRVLSL